MISAEFIEVCKKSNIDQLQQLSLHASIVQSNLMQLSRMMVAAAEKNQVELVQYLLTTPDLSIHASIAVDAYKVYKVAAQHQDNKLLHYLLTDSNLRIVQKYNFSYAYNPIFETAFNSACCCGNLSVVQYMMKEKLLYSYHKDMKSSSTAFYHACSGDNIALIEYLIKQPNFALRNVSVNASLNYAIENDKFDNFLFLLENMFLTVENLESALMHACQKNKLHFIEYLLNEKQVDINCLSNKPLSLAIDANHPNIVQYLLTSATLSKHAVLDDQLFLNGLKHFDVAQVLILQTHYRKPDRYNNFLFFSDFSEEYKQQLHNLFFTRQLQNTLPSAIAPVKRVKI